MPISKKEQKMPLDETIKQNPEWQTEEWQTVVDLSENSEFLKDLETYWQKFSTKRGKTFKEELITEKYPKSAKCPHGRIRLRFSRETINYLKNTVECNTTFTISYDSKLGLIVGHREFVNGVTIKRFEGTLDEFNKHIKKEISVTEKIHSQNLFAQAAK